MRHNRLLVLLVAGSAAFGQQGTAPTHSPQTKVDVEKLLTVQELESIGGRTVKRTVNDQGIRFTTAEQVMGAPADFDSLIVTLLPPLPDWAGWARGNGLETRVGGLGDDARQDNTKLVLAFRKGNRIVMLQTLKELYYNKPYFSPDQPRELGKLIASRL